MFGLRKKSSPTSDGVEYLKWILEACLASVAFYERVTFVRDVLYFKDFILLESNTYIKKFLTNFVEFL